MPIWIFKFLSWEVGFAKKEGIGEWSRIDNSVCYCHKLRKIDGCPEEKISPNTKDR